MSIEIDIHTLALSLSISTIVQIIALFFQYRVDRTHHGLGWWTLSSALIALGFAFNILRDYPSMQQVSVIANNALFFGGMIFLYVGILRFFDQRESRGRLIVIYGSVLLVIIYFTYLLDDINTRRVVMSAAIAAVSFLIAWTLYSQKVRSITSAANFLAVVMLVNGAFFTMRILATLFGATEESAFAPTLTQTSMYLLILVTGMLTTSGLILMVNQRVNVENREARQNYEMLFNTSPDAVVITRLSDGFFVEMNDGFFTMTGFTRADVIGRSSLDINLWKNPAERQELVGLLKEKGACENLEAVFQRKDGSELIGMVSAKVILMQGAPHMISVTRDITERKRIEAEKENANARLRTLSVAIEQSPVTTVITDLEGHIVFVNPKFTETTGYTAEEAIGQNPRILKTDFKARAEYKELWDTILSGQSWHGIFKNKKKNGALYWESATISPVKDEHGTITHFLAVKEDITERKQAEEALRENQRFLSQLIENNGAIIFAKDRAGRYELVNKKWEHDVGIPRDFAIGKTDAEIFPGHMSAEHRQSDLQVIESKGVVKTEETFRGLTGNRFYATIKFPLLDDNNEVKGVCGVTTDITERRQAEEELSESRTLFHLLIESLPQNIYVKDTNGRFIFANQHYCATEGKPLEEILGKTDFELHPLELAEKYLLDDRRVIETGKTVEIIEEHQPIGGQKTFVQVIKTPFHYSEGNAAGVLGIFWDVTERKQAEDALQQSAQEMERINRQLEISISNANEMAAQAVQAEAMIRESEEKFRVLANLLPQIVFESDSQGILTYVNRQAYKIFGYSEDEQILGISTLDFYSPESRLKAVENIRRSLAGEPLASNEYTLVRKDGSMFQALVYSNPIVRDGQRVGLRGIIVDITERKQLEDELHHQATTDSLTGVFNRRHFEQLATAEMKRAIRLGHPLTIVLIDIDHFKHVNDTYGHAAGDQALLTFTTLCQKNIREIDIFSRFGGDEFALLLPEANSRQAYAVIERIRQAIATEPINLDGKLISLTISSGIASVSDAGEDFDKLLIKADQALYRAKEAGRNKIVGHDEE